MLEAAQAADIYIPTLCHYPDLEPYGGCRLCLVEIEKMRGLPTACTTPAADGMVVTTGSAAIDSVRHASLELILTTHPCDCLECHRRHRCGPYDVCLRPVAVTDRCVTCPANEDCELQQVVDYVGVDKLRIPRGPPPRSGRMVAWGNMAPTGQRPMHSPQEPQSVSMSGRSPKGPAFMAKPRDDKLVGPRR